MTLTRRPGAADGPGEAAAPAGRQASGAAQGAAGHPPRRCLTTTGSKPTRNHTRHVRPSAVLLLSCTALLALCATLLTLAGPTVASETSTTTGATTGATAANARVGGAGGANATASSSAETTAPAAAAKHARGTGRHNHNGTRSSNASSVGADVTHGSSIKIMRQEAALRASASGAMQGPGAVGPPSTPGAVPPVPADNVTPPNSSAVAAARLASGRYLLQQSTSSFGGDCCSRLSAASVGFSGAVPLVLVDTGGSKIAAKEPPVRATICSCSPSGGSWDGKPYVDFTADALVKLRGSSSLQNNKKSYNLKFRARSPSGGVAKLMVPFLGMPGDDQWALYGPETDKTLGMRNVLAYDIFRRMGHWAPRTRYCEVFLVDDGSGTVKPSDYLGLFIATERVTVGPDRVNVRRMDPDKDLSGGYIFGYENDNIEVDDLTFRPATSLLNFVMHAPTFEDAARHPTPREAAALRWIAAYVNQMESALLTGFPGQAAIRSKAAALGSQGLTAGLPNGSNGPTAADSYTIAASGWRDLIEMESFIDYFLATELYKNPDGYRGSIYMSKNVGSPVAFGPPWDYNEAFGICCGYPIEGFDRNGVSSGSSGGSAISAEGWRFNICDQPERCKADPVDGISQYYRSAWRDPSLRTSVGQRWQQLRAGQLTDDVLASLVDSQTSLIRDAALRDYSRWSAIRQSPYFKSPQDQWQYEVGQLRGWLLARAQWMDRALADAARGGWGSVASTTGGPRFSTPAGAAPSTASYGNVYGGGGGQVAAQAAPPLGRGLFMNLLFGGGRRRR